MQGGNPAGAVTLVQQHAADLHTPEAELLLARAYEAQNNADAAAQHYQRIYVEYPLAKEASDAEAALRVVGAQRTEENYGLIANATQQILARRKSEVIRFKKYYNVDIDRLLNYDLVIDTTFAAVDGALLSRVDL